MASGKTLRKLLPFPKVGDTDHICADWESHANAVDQINEGHQDFLQAGVITATDWAFTANIVGGTGELGSVAATGGVAWVPDPIVAGALMRTVTANAAIAKKAIGSGALPANGKYACVGFELAPTSWGSEATVATKAGAERGTQAEAEAASPATTAGRVRVRDVIVLNTAGVYSIVVQFDRRPWARGANSSRTLGGVTQPEGGQQVVGLSQRVECSGAPVRMEFYAENISGAGTLHEWEFTVSGGGPVALFPPLAGVNHIPSIFEFVPAAGSHLFGVATNLSGGTKMIQNAVLRVSELLPYANNGTS